MALFRLSRPEQLLLMIPIYVMGVGAALFWGGSVGLATAIVGFVVFLPVAASIHYANEYADYETDLLSESTPFSGGSNALADTGLSRLVPKHATGVTAVVSLCAVVVAVAAGVLSTAAVVVLGFIGLLGWGYSLQPAAFAWRGLGELDNALLGGVILPVYGVAVVMDSVSVGSVIAFLPLGCAVFVNLLATTWPDRNADATVGKNTLATRLSVSRLRGIYLIGVIGLVATTLLGWRTVLPNVVVAVTLGSLPLFMWGSRRYTNQHSPAPTVVAMVMLALAQTAAWWWAVFPLLKTA